MPTYNVAIQKVHEYVMDIDAKDKHDLIEKMKKIMDDTEYLEKVIPKEFEYEYEFEEFVWKFANLNFSVVY